MSHTIESATYSTSEQVVGKWTDGKTLYRKVIVATFDAAIPSGSTTIAHNISNIAEVTSYGAMYNLGWDTSNWGNESYLAMNGFQVLAGRTNITINNVGSNSWSGIFKFILKYTKTS